MLNYDELSSQYGFSGCLGLQVIVQQVTINHSNTLLKEADQHLTSEGQLEGMLERYSVAANGLGEPMLQSKLHSPIQKCVDAIERCIQWRSQLQPLAEILRRNTQQIGRASCRERVCK